MAAQQVAALLRALRVPLLAEVLGQELKALQRLVAALAEVAEALAAQAKAARLKPVLKAALRAALRRAARKAERAVAAELLVL